MNPVLPMLDEVRELAGLLAPEWKPRSRALAASGVPVNEDGYPNPFGISQNTDGTALVVDDLVNPPAIIPELVRDFTAENEGYWIEEVYRTPGITVTGGAIRYTETYANDHFLDEDADVAPRSPGAEAPKISGPRRVRKLAFPESWSGSIDVTDEHRRWNQVMEVQDDFRRAGNSLAMHLQKSGEDHLADFVQASARFVQGVNDDFTDWAAAPRVTATDAAGARPSAEFARVSRLFQEDKSGVAPDLVIVSPEDAEEFDRVFEGQADAVLARYNLRMRVSVRRPVGRRLYVRQGQVGVMAFDKPLGPPEYTREGKRFTDVFTMEVAPVFVANGADAILEMRAA